MLPEAGTALAAYAALFASAFTSATLLPGSSEAMLLALLAGGHGAPPVLVRPPVEVELFVLVQPSAATATMQLANQIFRILAPSLADALAINRY